MHEYGKKAYVFYDDSWVGIEPYNDRFSEFGFDGIIKCVFSGYEARLCAGVDTEVMNSGFIHIFSRWGLEEHLHLQKEEILQGMQCSIGEM